MDPASIGALIQKLRKEAGLTQKSLAHKLCVTDKAVSKWERGMGCPDVSLLGALAGALAVDMASLLNGALPVNRAEGGNMKRTRIYLCPVCGNVLTAAAAAEISCCGRKLEPVRADKADPEHMPHLEKIDGEYCLTFDHAMSKEHHLRFVIWRSYDRMLLVRLYPEQDALVRIPQTPLGTLLIGCSSHGVMSVELKQLLS